VTGNRIGTNSLGVAAIPNVGPGITTAGGDVTIGSDMSAGFRNVVSGNAGPGIVVAGGRQVTITANYIGTHMNGSARVPNQAEGVLVTGGSAVVIGPRNVISGNVLSGVSIAGEPREQRSVTVTENYIGTNAAGTAALGNGREPSGPAAPGVSVTAPSNMSVAIGRNVISGNGGSGVMTRPVRVSSTPWEPRVYGNRIGTDAAGTAALPNERHGVEVWDSPGRVHIGVSAAGTTGNLISGNRRHGILLVSSAATVTGNHIGTDPAGSRALGNGGSGIYVASSGATIGGTGLGNVISGNAADGITIADVFGAPTSGNRVLGNRIGTNTAGELSGPGIGNGGHGVAIVNSSRNVVGSSVNDFAGEQNVIAFNGGSGVAVLAGNPAPGAAGAVDNDVGGNTFFANAALAIDLAGDGPTTNDAGDADEGPNRLLNYPTILEATTDGLSTTTFRYTFSGQPNRAFTLFFYDCPVPNATGRGQGLTRVHSLGVTTNSAGDAAGTVTISRLRSGAYLTALAATVPAAGDPPSANTSEFSGAMRVVRTRPLYRPPERPTVRPPIVMTGPLLVRGEPRELLG
jgi:hypothetical protein